MALPASETASSQRSRVRGPRTHRGVATVGAAGIGLAGLVGGALLVAVGGPATAAATCAATTPSPTATATATVVPTATGTTTATATPTVTPTAAPTASGDGSLLGGVVGQLPLGDGQGTTTSSPVPSTTATATPGATSSTTLALSARRVVKGEPVRITGTGLPGCRVQIYGYTRPSRTYKVVRSGTIADNGSYGFTVYPPSNTRVFAHSEGQGNNSKSAAVNVRFVVSLEVTRVGTRTYRYQGGVGPGAVGVPVTVWRSSSSGPVRVATTDTASNGAWSLVHTFGGTGTFTFYAVAATTANNDSNRSPLVRATIS